MKLVLMSAALAIAFAGMAAPDANAACAAKMKVAQLQLSSGGNAPSGLAASGSQTTQSSGAASTYKGTSGDGGVSFRRPPEDIITIPDDPAELCCQIGGCGCGDD